MSKKVTNGLEFLLKDHQLIKGIFSKISHPKTLEPKTRHELTHSVIKEICQHAAVEEEVVFPVVKYNSKFDGNSISERAILQNKELKNTMLTLEHMQPEDPQYETTLQSFISKTNEHMEEEEKSVYPSLETVLSPEELETMGELLEKLKKVAPTRPHPRAPSNMLTAPVTAFLDKVRDLWEKK